MMRLLKSKFIAGQVILYSLFISYGSSIALGVMGGMHGGGGVGIRCSGHLELLDLYEARQLGLKFIEEPKEDEVAISKVAELLALHFWNPETINLDEFAYLNKSRVLKPLYLGEGNVLVWNDKDGNDIQFPLISVSNLELSKDHNFEVTDPSCHLEQIIYFDENAKKIYVDQNRLHELSPLGRMALVIHEWSYFAYREMPMNVNDPQFGKNRKETSQEARLFTAKLLGETPLPRRSQYVPDRIRPTRCSDEDPLETAFYSLTNNGKYLWTFKVLYNYWTPYFTYVEFDENFENRILNWDQGSVHAEGRVLYDDGKIVDTGLRLEINKSKGGRNYLRMKNKEGIYIDQGPREIFCDIAEGT